MRPTVQSPEPKATPDYESAEISWDTSKSTDALVQFWEATGGLPRNRTAYQNELTETHSLTLPSLLPNHSYSFQVASRDAAGNTTVDDNGGQYYTFRTLQPITPPWTDDLNNSGTNWTVYNPGETDVSWQLGAPNNGWETHAHSPTNAWGSNLNGDPIAFVESYLISPAIDLTGGNVATLRFWHSYDFSDANFFEGGELLLIENNTLFTLKDYPNANDSDAANWTQAEFDLTPHIGHVIYLAWYYVCLSLDLEPAPRPGWLVDDVSVTVSNAVRGTLQITNNLAEARFTISGLELRAYQCATGPIRGHVQSRAVLPDATAANEPGHFGNTCGVPRQLHVRRREQQWHFGRVGATCVQ